MQSRVEFLFKEIKTEIVRCENRPDNPVFVMYSPIG